jgi:transposase
VDIMYGRCCGLDVHKQTVVACVLVPGPGRQPDKEIRTFGTITADLLELGDRLSETGVTHVALESTGVYWHPVWNLLECQVELLLVNAQHIKQVPGRKTDVQRLWSQVRKAHRRSVQCGHVGNPRRGYPSPVRTGRHVHHPVRWTC